MPILDMDQYEHRLVSTDFCNSLLFEPGWARSVLVCWGVLKWFVYRAASLEHPTSLIRVSYPDHKLFWHHPTPFCPDERTRTV